jgi:5'-phosphate synthase pdxT subunit
MQGPLVGVLALQGAFEEHQKCLEAVGCRTVQVRTPHDLEGLDGIVLPGGESTAMGLIGTSTATKNGKTMWECLKEFSTRANKPTWGTCAGMILLAEKCVGTSAVIENGQSLIGGIDITVCRNYFGSQVSSFEMETPPPPGADFGDKSFPGVFIRAPAILSAGPDVQVLGKVVATPCRQAAVTLLELERKVAAGENVIKMGVVDALERKSSQEIDYKIIVKPTADNEEEKKDQDDSNHRAMIVLPGAADGTNAREVICAARKNNLLCTAFHPEITDDLRWHEYFHQMVCESAAGCSSK